jgi:hypothetical protein
LLERISRVRAKAAVEVSSWRAEEQSPDRRQDGIPDVTILPRHRSSLNYAAEAISRYQIIAGAELRNERRRIREIIGIVGVAHDRRSQ